MSNPKIAERNQWRFLHVAKLFAGVFTGNEKDVENAVRCLSIRTGTSSEYGYTEQDILFFRDQAVVKPFMRSSISVELNGDGNSWRGLRAILDYKKQQFQKFNRKLNESGGASINERPKVFRDNLMSDIHNLTVKVNRLTRIETILNNQLKIRQTVGVSKPELKPELENEALIQCIIAKQGQAVKSSPASR